VSLFFTSVNGVFLSLCVSLFRVCVCVYYEVRNSPSSYRQPSGNGQLLSRRYCTQSEWLFLCAKNTPQESHGALAVSRKYFKQSNWPFAAAHSHAYAVYS